MNLYSKLWKVFSFEHMPIEELIEISSLVDEGKYNPGLLVDKKGNVDQIAGVIVALINEKSTSALGNKLYEDINELIVSKNQIIVNANSGKELYDKLIHEQAVGKYTIHRQKNGYRFALKAPSGEILAMSELYSSADSCMRGIESVRKNTNGSVEDQTNNQYDKVPHPKFEVYTDKNGEFRFRLKAKNGEIIAVSEGYKSKQSCLSAIGLVKYNAISNTIEKA